VKEVLELASVHSCGGHYNPQPAPALPSSSEVSICTFVPVKEVKKVPERWAKEAKECQYLYFCTSKASKKGTGALGEGG
jgi:hypothetical protein